MSTDLSPGRFITLEGSEGGGKSSNLPLVQQVLEAHDIEVVVTREPGGTELGEAVRMLLLDKQYQDMAHDSELLLMFAARSQHLAQVIEPALSAGRWILCDRFTDATYAYQGAGRGIPRERIAVLESWVQHGRQPDLTLLFDIPVATGLQRTRARQQGPDRFEQEKIEFFERIRQCYLQMADEAPQRYRIIDASRPLAEVQQSLTNTLDDYIRQSGG